MSTNVGTSRHQVAVIGAGAAGLTAAIRAAEAGARVTLYNAHPNVGLKILMSGGTRCNVTHREVSERDFNGSSRAFVRRVLAAFPVPATLEWMKALGVELKLEDTGKYFPVSDDAQTVLDALLGACTRAGVELIAGARVVRVERASGAGGRTADAARAPGATAEPTHVNERGKRSNTERTGFATAAGAVGTRFTLAIQRVRDSAAFGRGVAHVGETTWPLPDAAADETREADAVILACGGLSFPRTGSDGTGYALALALGHTLVPPVPALTPLAASDPLCASCQGMTLDAALSLWLDGKREIEISGSLLFAHFGYSGPAALDLSRHWLRAEGRARRVTASFALGETRESLERAWLDAARDARLTAKRWLAARMPERLANALCAEAGVDAGTSLAQVKREARTALLARVLERELPVTGTLGYEKAEVTAGGVRLAEVNPSTLESRVAPGVYLCGEILDVEGRLGGFNFQFSWSSGTVAGRSAARGNSP